MIDRLVEELIAHLEGDPAYDVEAFFTTHQACAAELRVRYGELRRLGLLPPRVEGDFSLFRNFGRSPEQPPLLVPDGKTWNPSEEERRIGKRYRIEAELRSAGTSRLFRGFDEVLERTVAIKLFQLPAGTDALSRTALVAYQAFLQEARTAGRLDHPNIVPVYDHGTVLEGVPYTVMPFVRGRTLQRAVEDLERGDQGVGTLHSPLRLLELVLAICDAIAYAHREKGGPPRSQAIECDARRERCGPSPRLGLRKVPRRQDPKPPASW